MANDFDLIVIGAGINGAGIARDAAQRGLKTCLLEQGDLCHGTTRWSSRLIHGGLRYLEHFELGLVYESLQERESLLRIAPHLVKPLRLMIPIYQGARRGRMTIAAGMLLYDILSRKKSLPSHQMLNAQEVRSSNPGLKQEGLVGAATYFDAQVTFAERLVVENALAAQQSGARIGTYCHVDHILTRAKRATGVRYTDLRTDKQKDLTAPVIVNAAGPWVDRVLEGLDHKMPQFMGGTKGTHIIVNRFAGAPDMACYVEAESDGRPFFIIPWNGLLLIGTTDIRFSGNPGLVKTDPSEIDYLVGETRRIFPDSGLDRNRVLYHYTGVRPLPRQDRKDEGEITRRHIVKHHRRFAKGLYSVIGGKLTTYRNLAEHAVDKVCRRLKRGGTTCQTSISPLPGAVLPDEEVVSQLERYDDISEESRDHLRQVYGSRALEVAAMVSFKPELASEICPHTHAIAAEIPFAFDKEHATTLADVLLRRSMIGLASDQGRAALPRAIKLGREVMGWTAARADDEERRYLREIERLR